MHTDNAGELSSVAVRDWASGLVNPIRITTCAPNVPREDGVMEGWWGMSNDLRSIILHANLPCTMWWYVLRAALVASCCVLHLDGGTPWQLFTGHVPGSVRQHRVVRCWAYYKLFNRQKRRRGHVGRCTLGEATISPAMCCTAWLDVSLCVRLMCVFLKPSSQGCLRLRKGDTLGGRCVSRQHPRPLKRRR